MSEAVMIALTKKGVSRQRAHEMLRRVSMRAYERNSSLLDEILRDEEIMQYFTKEEIEELIKPENYLGTAKKRIDRVVEWIKSVVG